MCYLLVKYCMFAFNRMTFMSYLLSLSVGVDGKILVFDHLCVLSTLCVALLDCIHFPLLGVVQANVGQKLIICDILRVFFGDRYRFCDATFS